MKPVTRRTILAQALCAPAIAGAARAQAYPTKTIRLIVPNPPGGPTDSICRSIAQILSETFKQAIIVENKPGASGMIGAEIVAKAEPDGHTLLATNQLLVQTPNLYNKVPYDPLRDLTPITDLISSPLWLAVNTAQSKATTLKELVEQIKAKPADANYASVGAGSIGHLYGFRLNEAAGVNMTHIPYKGAAPVVMALLSGEVTVALVDYATLKPHMAAGKVRALAVSDTKRSRLTPDVPTFTELGFTGFESSSWIGLFATAKTPMAIVERWNAEVAKILKQPDIDEKYKEQGFAMGGSPQAEFAALVAADFDRWARLIKAAGVKLD